MLKNRVFYITAVVLLFFFYIYCDSYMPLVILLIVAVLPIMTAVLGGIAARKTTVRVDTVLRSAVLGDEIPFCITIENKSHLPISSVEAAFEFSSSADGDTALRHIRTAMASGEKKTIFIYGTARHCCISKCKITKSFCSDAAGFARYRLRCEASEAATVVMPHILENGLNIEKTHFYAEDSDNYSDTQKGDDCSRVFEVREYIPGDDVRRIHWRLSSKQDILYVKEFSKPIADNCDIILETGIAESDSEETYCRTDAILAVFLTLTERLFSDEQTFVVKWFSQIANGLVSFEINSQEEIFPVVKVFLTEKFSTVKNASYIASKEENCNGNFSAYYIYDSEYSDINITEDLSVQCSPIDVRGVKKYIA